MGVAKENLDAFLKKNEELYQNQASAFAFTALFEQTTPGASKQHQAELKIILQIFLGKLHHQQLDGFNDKSTLLYEDAARLAENTPNTALQIWTNTQTGFYYYKYNFYSEALPHFLKASKQLDGIADHDLLQGNEVLKLNGYFFSTITAYENSIKYLNRALQLTPTQSKNYADILNNLGNCYFYQNNLDHALHYFEQTKKYALLNNDYIRYAKALGDLARVYIETENWELAETLLLDDIALSDFHNNDRNTMFAQLQLGKLYWKKGSLDHAQQTLSKVTHYTANKSYLKGFELEATEILLQIALKQDDRHKELLLWRELDSLQQLTKTESQLHIDQLALQIQKEKIVWQLEAEAEKTARIQLQKKMWSAVSFLLFVVVGLLYFLYKRRLKLRTIEFERKLLSFQYEKIQSEQKLKTANNSLTSFHIFLEEKNNQINVLEKEIQLIKGKKQKTTLEALLASHLMTHENWMLFKQAFIEDQQQFYNNLMRDFPDLTESNLRIILLQKIGLNNLESANLLGITPEAVKKSKQRMRKKYGDTLDQIVA